MDSVEEIELSIWGDQGSCNAQNRSLERIELHREDPRDQHPQERGENTDSMYIRKLLESGEIPLRILKGSIWHSPRLAAPVPTDQTGKTHNS